MNKIMATSDLLHLIDGNIAICDGGGISFREEQFIKFLKHINKSYTIEEDLYDSIKDFDKTDHLSKYNVIAFQTTGVYEDKFKKIIEFDKSNLKCIVLLERENYRLVRDLANFLGIYVIHFSTKYWGFYENGEYKEKDVYEKILRFPEDVIE